MHIIKTYRFLNPDDLLGNILAGGSNPADRQEHVILSN